MGSITRRTAGGVVTGAVLAAGLLSPHVLPVPGADPATEAEPARGAAAAGPGTRSVERLQEDLDAILDRPELAAAQAAVLVREADGTTLYGRDTGERLLPASNMKLLTSAAALEVLGAEYRFATDVAADGVLRGTVLAGDLYLRGTGDPSLLAGDLDDLAAEVAASGIETVTGRLVADASAFDDVPLGDSWAWDDESAYYAPQISALTLSPDEDYDTGTVRIDVVPGPEAGAPTGLTVVPADEYVEIVDRTTTGPAGGSGTVSARREHGTNTIVVSGELPADAAVDRNWVTVGNPARYTAEVFRAALARHGVRVKGRTTSGVLPGDALPLAERRSAPLADLMVPFLKLSNNGHAELLVKAMGREVAGEGGWEAGLDVMADALGELGVRTSVLRLADGSGLSRKDLLTAEEITTVLSAARTRPWFDAWYDALPIAGISERMVGGTLNERMAGTAAAGNVHAKTGSLTGVTALSGYVTDADGELLVFSVIHNNYVDGNPKEIEDRIAVRLAEFTRGEFTRSETGLSESARSGARRPYVPRLPSTDYGPLDRECSWIKAC